jgi:hypothetical protein
MDKTKWWQSPFFKKMWDHGCPTTSIAMLLGAPSCVTVNTRAAQLGWKRQKASSSEHHYARWTDRERELINYMFDQGMVPDEIAQSIPRTPSAIRAEIRARLAREGKSFSRVKASRLFRYKDHAELAAARATTKRSRASIKVDRREISSKKY